MKYNQPFDQPSNPNAPYVDGNPSAGIQGSIVPAAAIEYPQREIINAITAAGLTGDNADLTQLLKMLKIMDVFNKFKLGTNQGSASQWSTTIPALPIMPPPAGTAIWFHPVYDSVKGGTVFSVNGSPFAPVANSDGTPVGIGDVIGTTWLLLFFDGTSWLCLAGGRIPGALPLLKKNTIWYVNGATGDDTNFDGTSATVASSTVGPFRTLQRASGEIVKYNMNGYNQNILVADGTYTGPIVFGALNGSGSVIVSGNPTNPQNVTLTTGGSQNNAVTITGGNYTFDGFRLTTPPGNYDGLAVYNGICNLHAIRFGPCAQFHLSSSNSGSILTLGPGTIVIEAGANALSHLFCQNAGNLNFPVPQPANWPFLSILGPVNFSQAFVTAYGLGVMQMHYNSISGAASVTGPKYLAIANAMIDSIGGGPSYFPGNSPGSVLSGGQYL